MKKLILSTALIMISLQGALYAQPSEYREGVMKSLNETKAQQTFNANEALINIRDFVTLKEGRLILELSDLDDYESFRNLDSILQEFRKDIAFYKDSLASNPTGNVRIDYCFSPGYNFKKIRFKEYKPDGNMFLNQGGDISRLKFAQDTVRIVIEKSRPGIARRNKEPCMIPYSIQATFIIDNYYDVDKIVADNVLKSIVDTLEKESQQKRHQGIKIYSNPLSIIYNPYYSGKTAFRRYNLLLNNEYDFIDRPRNGRYLSVKADMGAGLVRNTVAPMAEIGLQYNKYWKVMDNHDIYRLSVSPYCFFNKDAQGNFTLNDNWFINLDIGSIYEGNQYKWLGKEASFGFGYLFAEKGGYFKNTTFKIFTDLRVVPGFTIAPEFIFTDNCKQIYPGFTLKVL